MSFTKLVKQTLPVVLAATLLVQGCATKQEADPDSTLPEAVATEAEQDATDQPAGVIAPEQDEDPEQALARLKQQRVESMAMNLTPEQAEQAKQAQPAFEQAIVEMRKGNLESALQQFQALSQSYPALSGPVLNQAIVLRKMDKTQEAYDLLQSSLMDHGKNPFLLNELGVLSRQLGKFKQAQASYESAIRIDENYPSAHYNLAVLADLYLHDPEMALNEFRTYQNLLPKPDKKVEGWIKELERRAAR